MRTAIPGLRCPAWLPRRGQFLKARLHCRIFQEGILQATGNIGEEITMRDFGVEQGSPYRQVYDRPQHHDRTLPNGDASLPALKP